MKTKLLITLAAAGIMSIHMTTVMSAPETDTDTLNPSTSDFLNRGDLVLNNHLPSFGYNSLQLAQADTGDKDKGASGDSPKEGEYTQAQITEMMNNPLGELWMLFGQNDTTWYDGDALDFLGEDKKVFNTTTLMPVMPMQLTENWKYIFRPVIPIHHWDAPSVSQGNAQYPGGDLPFSVNFDRQTELGDIVLWNAFATNEMARPPNIFGVGATVMLDTATEDVFGTGKNSVGPMALAFHIGDVGVSQ